MKILKRNPEESYAAYVYRMLQDNILLLELKPGEVINEKQIAEELNISRTPVHEAVLKLKEENLIEIHARKESKVSLIDVDLVNEGFFLRKVIDTEVLRLAVLKIGPEDREKMKDNLAKQEACLQGKKYNDYMRMDEKFHELIYQSARKPVSYRTIHGVSSHLTRLRYLMQDFALHKFLPNSYEDHRKMLDLITFGIPEGLNLSEFVEKHMNHYQKYLPAMISVHREYFKF